VGGGARGCGWRGVMGGEEPAGGRAALSLHFARFCLAWHKSQTPTSGVAPLAVVAWTPRQQRTTGRQAVLACGDPDGDARAKSSQRAIPLATLRIQRWQPLHWYAQILFGKAWRTSAADTLHACQPQRVHAESDAVRGNQQVKKGRGGRKCVSCTAHLRASGKHELSRLSSPHVGAYCLAQ